MDILLLKEAGLTEGETKVYLALLELGSTTSGPIIEKSKISRSIIYTILEKLIEKGLVSFIIKEKTKYFQSSDPNKILQYLEEKEKSFKDLTKKTEEIIKELQLKQKFVPKSEALIYFGFKGIRSAHESLYNKLKKGEEYYYLGIPAYQPEEQHIYWKKDQAKRINFGIKCKFLYNKDTDIKILKNRNSYKGCKVRYMPIDIKTPATFLIYKDTIVIILQEPQAIAIEIINQDIANSFKAYFDEFWKISKPLTD